MWFGANGMAVQVGTHGHEAAEAKSSEDRTLNMLKDMELKLMKCQQTSVRAEQSEKFLGLRTRGFEAEAEKTRHFGFKYSGVPNNPPPILLLGCKHFF
jgi:hypothetical protein